MSDMDKKLRLLNDGKIASLAAEHIGPLIHEMKVQKMLVLSQAFRNGKIDQATLVAGIAGFCALEDLEILMKHRIQKGQQASHELNQEQMT